MLAFEFTVYGPPVPWQRPSRGKDGRMHTPKRSKKYQRLIADIAGLQRPRNWPMNARYQITWTAYVPDLRRRDMDNLEKNLCDGLTGVLYDDDSQIDDVDKHRFVDARNPRLEVRIEPIAVSEAKCSSPSSRASCRPQIAGGSLKRRSSTSGGKRTQTLSWS